MTVPPRLGLGLHACGLADLLLPPPQLLVQAPCFRSDPDSWGRVSVASKAGLRVRSQVHRGWTPQSLLKLLKAASKVWGVEPLQHPARSMVHRNAVCAGAPGVFARGAQPTPVLGSQRGPASQLHQLRLAQGTKSSVMRIRPSMLELLTCCTSTPHTRPTVHDTATSAFLPEMRLSRNASQSWLATRLCPRVSCASFCRCILFQKPRK